MEPRDIKRLIFAGIILILAFFAGLDSLQNITNAKKNGFKNVSEYEAYLKEELEKEKEKEITIYTNGNIKDDEYFVEILKENGFYPTVKEDASYNYSAFYMYTKDTDKINIIDTNIYSDYLSSIITNEDEKDDENNEKIEKVLSGITDTMEAFSEKDIIIISPKYQIPDEEEKALEAKSGKYSYEDFIDTIIEGCEKNNLSYINLYEYTKNNPIKIEEANMYNKNIQEYMANEILKILQK